jgi:hypothetical protein
MRNKMLDLDQESTIVSMLILREPLRAGRRRRTDIGVLTLKLVVGCAGFLVVLFLGGGSPWQ